MPVQDDAAVSELLRRVGNLFRPSQERFANDEERIIDARLTLEEANTIIEERVGCPELLTKLQGACDRAEDRMAIFTRVVEKKRNAN